jgi:hypothetical protein
LEKIIEKRKPQVIKIEQIKANLFGGSSEINRIYFKVSYAQEEQLKTDQLDFTTKGAEKPKCTVDKPVWLNKLRF